MQRFSGLGITLEFGVPSQVPTKPLNKIQARSFEQASKKIEDEVKESNEEKISEEYMENLNLIDPLAYEKLVSGEILGDGRAP